MAAETLQVSAVSSPDDWSLGGGSDKVSAVQSPDDADTSYIEASAGSQAQQQFAVANPADITESDTISSVKLISRVRKTAAQAAQYRHVVVLGANESAGSTKTLTTSYADYEDSFTTKPGGGSWTLTDLQNMEVRAEHIDELSIAERLTTFKVEVTYETPRTATAAPTTGGADCSASAAFTMPTFTATSAPETGGAECSASASFAPGTKSAIATLATGGAQCAADAQALDPIYAGTGVLTTAGAEVAAAATFIGPRLVYGGRLGGPRGSCSPVSA